MSDRENIRNSPSSITVTKSSENIKVTLNLELSSPEDMENALSLIDEIKQTLSYSRADFVAASERGNIPQYFYQMDLPQSIRHKLVERAMEENCSINTLCVHWLSLFCERGFD